MLTYYMWTNTDDDYNIYSISSNRSFFDNMGIIFLLVFSSCFTILIDILLIPFYIIGFIALTIILNLKKRKKW